MKAGLQALRARWALLAPREQALVAAAPDLHRAIARRLEMQG